MFRLIAFIPAWWFLQVPNPTIWKDGIGIGMVILIAWLWERDSKRRIVSMKESDKRYSAIVEQLFEQQKELKSIVSGNTTAMTTPPDKLSAKISNCPMASDPVMGAWIRTWMEHSAEESTRRREQEIRRNHAIED